MQNIILETCDEISPKFYKKLTYYQDGHYTTQYYYKGKLHNFNDQPADITYYPKRIDGEDLVVCYFYQLGKLKRGDLGKPEKIQYYGDIRVDTYKTGRNSYIEYRYQNDKFISSRVL
jgi:hypothetical protein